MFRLQASPLTWCTSSPASAVGNSTSGKPSRHYTSAWTAIDRTSGRRPKKSWWRLIFAQTATPWAISVWLWLINSTRETPCSERTSTPAHCEKGKLAVEPDEQQALTYLNRERKIFWAGICLFPSSYPARYFRNKGFSLTGKEIELPWQPRAQHPFIFIGFDVRLAKSFIRSGIFFFQSKLCPRSIWYGVWFSDQKLRRAKKTQVESIANCRARK